MGHRQEARDVVAVKWVSPHDGAAAYGRIVSRTKSSALVEWNDNGMSRPERVHFDNPNLTFFTADEEVA